MELVDLVEVPDFLKEVRIKMADNSQIKLHLNGQKTEKSYQYTVSIDW